MPECIGCFLIAEMSTAHVHAEIHRQACDGIKAKENTVEHLLFLMNNSRDDGYVCALTIPDIPVGCPLNMSTDIKRILIPIKTKTTRLARTHRINQLPIVSICPLPRET